MRRTQIPPMSRRRYSATRFYLHERPDDAGTITSFAVLQEVPAEHPLARPDCSRTPNRSPPASTPPVRAGPSRRGRRSSAR